MAVLGRLIEDFPAVRSATVLLAPGRDRGIGREGCRPAASVRVELADGAEMTPALLQAITDQVCGAVEDLAAADVRVVEGRGRSYCLGRSSPEALAALQSARLAEGRICRQVRQAMGDVAGLRVAARVPPAGPGEPDEPACVSVSLPRPHLVGLCRAAGASGVATSPTATEAAVRPHLERIRGRLERLLAGAGVGQVDVDWHYAADAARAVAAALDEPPGGVRAAAWSGGGCILLGLGCGAAWLRRRGKRRAAGAAQAPGNPPALAAAARPFAFLERVSDDALLAAVGAEPLDAIALVLAHLPADRTARLLGGLSPRAQVEVTGRIAKLSDPPADEAWRVHEALAARFRPDGTLKDGPVGGVSAAAEILERAGYATEQSVLGELGRREPILAASIRRRMFAFDDIALLPASRLGRVLESIDDGELAVALRTTDEGLQGRVLAALSPRAAARVRQEMERIGPVRLRDVEVAQQHVAESILRMDAGGYLAGAPEPDREVLA